jgi:hypothetical protein
MIALASALFTTTAANAATLDGSFNGHCDGFALTLKGNGAASGVETGCESGPIAGRQVAKLRKGSTGAGAVTNENHVANAVYEINTTFHTYAIYQSDGSILETGTWTAVPQSRANRGLPPTGARK